jgi:hypothetical protein
VAPSNFTTLNMSHCNRMEPSGDHYTMPMLPMISFLVTFGLIIGCDDLLNVHPVRSARLRVWSHRCRRRSHD